MPRKLNLSILEQMLDAGNGFELTPAEYERIVGKAMPETDEYFIKRSKVAKAARERGFTIRLEDREVIQRTIVFERIMRNGN